MIEQVRELLVTQNVARAVIIDDAFDECPTVGDLEHAGWDRFFDDLTDKDNERLAGLYGSQEYEAQGTAELRRSQPFIKIVWGLRPDIPAADELCAEFARVQERKREELVPLQGLLVDQLKLDCKTAGRASGADAGVVAAADLIFLDLFLGYVEVDAAIDAAITRVNAIVDGRREAPPTVILISASPEIFNIGPRLRDEAELLGCQFRMMRKADLADSIVVSEQLFELAVSRKDALKLNGLMTAWSGALDRAKAKFLRSIRSLDLADYVNMQDLVLEAEGEPVGDFVLDLYDVHLHSILEADVELVRAAKALNDIKWDEYPPAQFMPSAEAADMMDGAWFHNSARTRTEAEVDGAASKFRLGDVFIDAPAPAAVAGDPIVGAEAAATAKPERKAYVVISQPCDLQHGNVDRLLVLGGAARPYTGRLTDAKGRERLTPLMKVGDDRWTVGWDVANVETWPLSGMQERIAKGIERVRRFRAPFALQLQQAFTSQLGRVGTLVALPARHAVIVRVFLKLKNGKARLLHACGLEVEEAVCLVGRTAKNAPIEMLVLSEPFRREVRRRLREVDSGELPTGGPKVSEVREDVEFYRLLRRGLPFKREKAKRTRPFSEDEKKRFDIVTIIVGSSIVDGEPMDNNLAPLVFEVELA